ncbi:helix-turn-helix transcriptional regulator [Paenibacillus sp. BK720]|uniref:helix-turn-helix domain-containing protein n=1 Tax=Paenibacillus sp. BK720 TaxID=2587092 RepID=UPI001424A5A9|nr:helix-turn-helix transcriptional regulator [Paenibacillus sp. BK720]NIK68773.1 transcriptional regulator with XRE-family HTH domain [Paenibacillus sp. BK720]
MNVYELGQYLKSKRIQKNLTLDELGELTGYSNPYLSQIENGRKKKMPSPELLKKLGAALGVEYSLLMQEAGYWDWISDPEADPDTAFADLGAVLHSDKVVWGTHTVTEKERAVIKAFLDVLFSSYSDPKDIGKFNPPRGGSQ